MADFMDSELGTLWGVSVGPGDPEWLTLKGLKVLQRVPAIAMPQNRQGQPGMAFEIVKDYLDPSQILVPLHLPFVKDPEILKQSWQTAAELLSPHLRSGQDVAFISEGDVSFYSTFTYVATALRRQIPNLSISVIPGVCSPLAAAGALEIPLAIQAEKIAVLPALYDPQALLEALKWSEVVVLMKVSTVFHRVWTLLADQGLLEQSYLVEWVGGTQQQLFPNLVDLADYHPPYFSILIVRRHSYEI